VRSLAVRPDHAGKGLGRRIVEHLLVEAGRRGCAEVLALTRRSSFFDALGFQVTRRERFIDKLMVDCGACPLNVCCDEIAMVRPPARPGEFTPLPAGPPPAHKEL
jgi:amino-acid N-acetyltransferase